MPSEDSDQTVQTVHMCSLISESSLGAMSEGTFSDVIKHMFFFLLLSFFFCFLFAFFFQLKNIKVEPQQESPPNNSPVNATFCSLKVQFHEIISLLSAEFATNVLSVDQLNPFSSSFVL